MVYGQAPYYAKSYFKGPTKRLARRLPVAKKVKKYVHKAIRQDKEVNSLTTTIASHSTGYDVAAGTMFQDLTSISAGDSANNRAGNQVYIRSLVIRVRIPEFLFTTATIFNVPIRVIVFQWLENDGSVIPSLQNLFGTAGSASSIDDPVQKNSPDGDVRRYKMLYDRRFILGESNSSSPNSPYKMFTIRIPWKRFQRKVLKYNGTATDSGENHIYFGAFTNATDASGDDPNVLCVSEVKFLEK